jgi:RNA polymerase sigma factor (sigma-70 family)
MRAILERNHRTGASGGSRKSAGDWVISIYEALEKCRANVDATEDELFTKIHERVFGLVRMTLVALNRHSRHYTEDLTQDVLVKLLKLEAFRNYDPRKGSLQAWLYGVIRWTVVAAIRRERLVLGEPTEYMELLADSGPTPDQRAEQMDLLELVQTWVSELTDNRRVAIERKYFPKPDAVSDGPEALKERVNRSRGLADLQKIAGSRL